MRRCSQIEELDSSGPLSPFGSSSDGHPLKDAFQVLYYLPLTVKDPKDDFFDFPVLKPSQLVTDTRLILMPLLALAMVPYVVCVVVKIFRSCRKGDKAD